MEVIEIINHEKFIKEYFRLCFLEWGDSKREEPLENIVNRKYESLLNKQYNQLISALGLVDQDELIGFISLVKTDGKERCDLTPWYATMYVKKEKRGKGYSKILNKAIIEEAKKLGYHKIYLKSDLVNYYEKFGAQFMELLKNGEKLYCIDTKGK